MFPKFARFATAAAMPAAVLAALCFGGTPARAQAQAQGAVARPEMVAPDALVKTVTLEVVDIIQKDKEIQGGGADGKKKVVALIETKVLPHFNFQAMTASAVGRNWDKANAEQKLRLTDEFKTLLVRTYSSALASYSSQKFDFRPLRAKPTDTDVTVNVRIMQSGTEPVTIDYDMEKRPGGWKVWDVRVGGISLVANYRTEFDNLIRDGGVEGLIKALYAKNSSQAQTPVAGAQKK